MKKIEKDRKSMEKEKENDTDESDFYYFEYCSFRFTLLVNVTRLFH